MNLLPSGFRAQRRKTGLRQDIGGRGDVRERDKNPSVIKASTLGEGKTEFEVYQRDILEDQIKDKVQRLRCGQRRSGHRH